MTRETLTLKQEIALELTRSRIRRLSPQQRKVLAVLHSQPGLCNEEIARLCFTTNASISVTLSDLRNLNILEKRKPEIKDYKRRSIWFICDQEILDAMEFTN